MVRDARENVGEVSLRIDAVHPSGFDDGVDAGGALPPGIGATKQIILSSQNHRGSILPISTRMWRCITAGTRCMAARSGSCMPNGALTETLPSLRPNRA